MFKRKIFLLSTFVLTFTILNLLSISFYAYQYGLKSYDLSKYLYNVNREEARALLRVKFVTVNYEGNIKKHLTRSYSPVTALVDLGYELSNMNTVVSTSPISYLFNYAFISVDRYTTTIDEIEYEIPFDTITKGYTLCQKLSEEEVEQEGVMGVMVKRIKKIYKGEELIAEELVEENLKRKSIPEIVILKGPDDTPNEVPQRGYNCPYWYSYVDTISATDEEKQWLKFVMKGESGCNAENNKGFYKGLFQWNPCIWYSQYPTQNIFDGTIQIKRALEKLRAGANPNNIWPAVHRRYVATYGELSWLK